MSKILSAMRKSSGDVVDFNTKLKTIDKGNLFPLPDESQGREFEQLANSLIHLNPGKRGNVVVFASTYPGEGSSFVSYNCARYLTLLLDEKVAWVDANFQRPQRKLNKFDLNFRDLLNNPGNIECLDDDPELTIIGNGLRDVKSTDLLNGPEYAEFQAQMQEKFYFTIIDASPILQGVEVAHLANHTMGLVLVVESERLKHEVIKHGLERLKAQGVTIIGTVLNKRKFQLPDFIYKRL